MSNDDTQAASPFGDGWDVSPSGTYPSLDARPGSDGWYCLQAQYIAGITCGHHNTYCEGPDGHWELARLAKRAGFDPFCYPENYQDPGYRRWLLSTFVPGEDPFPESATPIEQAFWTAHQQLRLPELRGLVAQHQAGRFRIDFALPALMIGIELDGFASHSSTADIARDRMRERWLQANGWRIIRFGGSEVHHDAGECVRQAAYLVRVIEGGSP
jgi:very-short-patch-repair endonuclease